MPLWMLARTSFSTRVSVPKRMSVVGGGSTVAVEGPGAAGALEKGEASVGGVRIVMDEAVGDEDVQPTSPSKMVIKLSEIMMTLRKSFISWVSTGGNVG